MASGVRFIVCVTTRPSDTATGHADCVQGSLPPGPAAAERQPDPIPVVFGSEHLEWHRRSQPGAQSPAHLPVALSVSWWMARYMDGSQYTRCARQVDGEHWSPADTVQREGTRAWVGLTEIGRTHRYAAAKFAVTLASTQTLVQTGHGDLQGAAVPAVALARLSQTYLQAMLAAVDSAANAIVTALAQQCSPEVCGAQQRRRIDRLSDDFLRRVRMLLHPKENSHGEERPERSGVGTHAPNR